MTDKGLYIKYHVEKADGTPVDPEAVYFVLRIDTDRDARSALWFYAERIAETAPELADDLKTEVLRYAIR